jgi:hypothetical protein
MTAPGSSRYFDFAPTDRAMAVLADDSSFVLQLELEFDARLDGSRLRSAVELLARRHPILTATVDRGDSRAVWRPGTTVPELVDAPDTDDEVDLDPSTGPTCVVVHLHDRTRSRLRIALHHAVADARGLVVLLDDLCALYTGLASSGRPVVDVDWSDRTIGALLDRARFSAGDRVRLGWNAASRWAVRASTHRDDVGEPGDDAPPEPAGDWSTRFESAQLDAVEAAGTGRGWRRNHVLLAVIARAWLDTVGHTDLVPSVSGWLVGVDCRRQLGAARGVGNLSGLEPVSLLDLESTDLPGTVDAVRHAFTSLGRSGAGMVADLTGLPKSGRVPGPLVDRAMRGAFELRAATDRYTRFYSHVDAFPESLAEWGDAELVGARWRQSAPCAPPYVALLLTTFRAATTLTVIAAPAVLAPARARALATRATELVDELVAGITAPVAG